MNDFSIANIDIVNLKGDIRYKGRKCGTFEVVNDDIDIRLITETSKKTAQEIGESVFKNNLVSKLNASILKNWEETWSKKAEEQNIIFAIKKNGDGILIYEKPTKENIEKVNKREDIEKTISKPKG